MGQGAVVSLEAANVPVARLAMASVPEASRLAASVPAANVPAANARVVSVLTVAVLLRGKSDLRFASRRTPCSVCRGFRRALWVFCVEDGV